jgi:hypothetical protein
MVIKLFEYSNENVCACALVFFIHQSIDLHIFYLCCEYPLIWTFNEWSIYTLILTNQNKEHIHTHVCWNIYLYQYIDVYLSYVCCEFQLIWTFHEWFTGHQISVNQNQALMYVRVHWYFRWFTHYSFMLWILDWTFNKWFICVLVLASQTEAHVHACARWYVCIY